MPSRSLERIAALCAVSVLAMVGVFGCGATGARSESKGDAGGAVSSDQSTAPSATSSLAATTLGNTSPHSNSPANSASLDSVGDTEADTDEVTSNEPPGDAGTNTNTAIGETTNVSHQDTTAWLSSEAPNDAAASSSSSDVMSEGDSSDTNEPSGCDLVSDEFSVIGYGEHTTGGGAATPVIVTSFEQAAEALDVYRDAFEAGTQTSLVLRYAGAFDFATVTDVCAQHTKDARILYIKEMENVTLEGTLGSSANFGIKINRAKNVIVRNMTIGLLPGGGDSDAITIEGNGSNGDVEHVWIDHNDLFSSTKDDCDGAGDTEFDGLIDIKKGARFITISYNRLHDHQKTGLLGSSDTDDMERFVTFHHNWYEEVVSRTPLHRFGYVHLFNNYFNRILDSGINVRMGGVALIESNYFSNAANPVTSRYSDQLGYWDLRNNYVGENVTWTETEDTLANAEDWSSSIVFPAEQLTYEYPVDDAECVKAIVTTRAGATLDID